MPKKILLADDSITIQKVVELTFSDGDYEVTAVNNGAKAIQKLAEMRPDIILSDIIMPEKNGYEVCEYVKSHPEYRNIPVVLLTGTFEPFDPDRAEKAGCDAVVTKPFESQSLIHKVEELIAQAQAAARPLRRRARAARREAAASPWMDETARRAGAAPPIRRSPRRRRISTCRAEPPFTARRRHLRRRARRCSSTCRRRDPVRLGARFRDAFGGRDAPAFGGETRAFPRMSFDEMQQMATGRAAAGPSRFRPFDRRLRRASSPWDEPPRCRRGETASASPDVDSGAAVRRPPTPRVPADRHFEDA